MENHLDLLPLGKFFSYVAAKNHALIHRIVLSFGGLHLQAPYWGFVMDRSALGLPSARPTF